MCPSRGVIHMPVGKAHVVNGDDFSRCSTDVEAHAVFWGGNDGFLARKRESDQSNARKFLLDQPAHVPFIRQNRPCRPVGTLRKVRDRAWVQSVCASLSGRNLGKLN